MTKKPLLLLELTQEDREELARWMCLRRNELAYQASGDDADLNWGARKRRLSARADLDWEEACDTSVPLTVAQVERFIRSIGELPVCAFYGCPDNGDQAMAFIDRMRSLCRRARLRTRLNEDAELERAT